MKKILGIILGLMSVMFLLTGCSKTIDLNDFVTVEIEGYNGKGNAIAKVDEEALAKEAMNALGLKSDSDFSEKSFEKLADLEKVMYGYKLEFDKDSDLKNGDKVTLTAKLDEDSLRDSKIKLKFKDITTTVEGLEKAKVIGEKELFKDLTVTFNGIAPNGTAIIENKSKDDIISKIDFKIVGDDVGGLNNGDKITIEADIENIYGVNLDGIVLESAKKDYEVNGLDEYLKSFDDLDKETKDKILNRANEITNANIIGQKSGKIADFGRVEYIQTISNLALQDSYFLCKMLFFNFIMQKTILYFF